MSSIFSRLPFILSHADFSSCNIMVQQVSGRLTGVIDWAEATICPFGQNLYTLQDFSGTLHRNNGWRQYKDHETLQETFWQTFQQEVGGLSAEVMEAVRSARILGCLLTHGFIRRLANEQFVVPIQEDDEIGRYNMLFLDAYLVDVKTRFEDLNWDESRSKRRSSSWRRRRPSVPEIFATVFLRNSRFISTMSVPLALTTNRNIHIYARFSVISSYAKASNTIRCLIGQFSDIRWLCKALMLSPERAA